MQGPVMTSVQQRNLPHCKNWNGGTCSNNQTASWQAHSHPPSQLQQLSLYWRRVGQAVLAPGPPTLDCGSEATLNWMGSPARLRVVNVLQLHVTQAAAVTAVGPGRHYHRFVVLICAWLAAQFVML